MVHWVFIFVYTSADLVVHHQTAGLQAPSVPLFDQHIGASMDAFHIPPVEDNDVPNAGVEEGITNDVEAPQPTNANDCPQDDLLEEMVYYL